MKTQWPDEIARLLQNWARWVISGGKDTDRSPYPAYNLSAPGPRGCIHGAVIPTLHGEAETTDHIIIGLSMRYQQPLRMHYIWPNVADVTNAKRCSCCLNTYKVRLIEAHILFSQAWYSRPARHAFAGVGVRMGSRSVVSLNKQNAA